PTRMNALIQGSAARHTKLWMRACWREGIVPLLQMHDALDCSVACSEQAERVAQLGREAVTLEVPMQVDLKFGHNWGDEKHTWAELNGAAVHKPAANNDHSHPVEEPKPCEEPVSQQAAEKPRADTNTANDNSEGFKTTDHNTGQRDTGAAPHGRLSSD